MSDTPIKTCCDFIDALHSAKWSAFGDSQHYHITLLWAKMERARRSAERELAAMTAAKELAERQVAIMCTLYDRHTRLEDCAYCPAKSDCPDSTHCEKTLAAWSRAEAAKSNTNNSSSLGA